MAHMFQVIATARRPETLADLRAAGMETLRLDVTQTEHIRQVAEAMNRRGRLDILVNNAGYGLFGPLMELSQAELEQQFATNVFAPLALAQAIAPLMRRQGSGIILNVASISSVFTPPFAGAYCGSKAALRAMSEALRMELAPFGIQVVTVNPGAIASEFGNNAGSSQATPHTENSWYAPVADKIQQRAKLSQEDATSSEVFARQLVQKIQNPPISPEIWLGKKSFRLPVLKRWLPTQMLDKILLKRFGLDSLNE